MWTAGKVALGGGPPTRRGEAERGGGLEGSGVVRRNSRTRQGWKVEEMAPRRWLMCWNRGKAEHGISANGGICQEAAWASCRAFLTEDLAHRSR